MDSTCETLQWQFTSPVGPIFLVANSKGLEKAVWEKQSVPMAQTLSSPVPAAQFLSEACKQLEEYFGGQRTSFDLPFSLKGTPFQLKVWKALTSIPYGQTWSYQRLASQIQNQKACRAVGSANGKNPLSLFIPCHRVIRESGALGGYAGGTGIKEKLLSLEKGLT